MEKSSPRHLYFKAFAIVLTILIILLSLMPSRSVPEIEIKHLDKLVHIAMYFVLTISYVLSFREYDKPVIMAFSGAFLVGVLTEVMQYKFTSSRFFDFFDIIANTAGSFFAILFFKIYLYPRK